MCSNLPDTLHYMHSLCSPSSCCLCFNILQTESPFNPAPQTLLQSITRKLTNMFGIKTIVEEPFRTTSRKLPIMLEITDYLDRHLHPCQVLLFIGYSFNICAASIKSSTISNPAADTESIFSLLAFP